MTVVSSSQRKSVKKWAYDLPTLRYMNGLVVYSVLQVSSTSELPGVRSQGKAICQANEIVIEQSK